MWTDTACQNNFKESGKKEKKYRMRTADENSHLLRTKNAV